MGLPYLALNIDVTDQARQGLYASFSSATKIAAPVGVRGNGLYLAIRAMQPDASGNQTWDDIDISTATVTAAIDQPDIPPASGDFTLSFGPTPTSGTVTSGSTSVTITGSTAGLTGTMGVSGAGIQPGTTATISGTVVTLSLAATASGTSVSLYFFSTSSQLAAGVAAGTLATALNALPFITASGGVTVAASGSDYEVTWNSNGAQPLLTGNPASLFPASTIQIIEAQAGNGNLPEIQIVRILQQAAALQNVFTPFPGAAAQVVTLTAGGGGINNLQQITLFPVPYAGTWTVQTASGTTSPLPYNVTASALAAALNGLPSTPAGTWLVSGAPGGPYNITNTTGTAIAALVANVSGLTVPIGMQGELNLATPGMLARFDALAAGVDELETLLEITIQFPGSDPQTILQAPITLLKSVYRSGALVTPPYAVGLTLSTADARYMPLAQANASFLAVADPANPGTLLFKLWNPTQNKYQAIGLTGAAGSEQVVVLAD